MIATFETFDILLTEATRQAARNAEFANDTVRRYMDEVSTANSNQFAALDALQQALFKSVFDIQTASLQLSRTVGDAASTLNRAIARWALTAIFPGITLGSLTEPARTEKRSWDRTPESDDEATRIGDVATSALRFQGPMSVISSGMGEYEG
ncbi:MAG TPA: hypothetical protein VHS06_05480 [Chloroflexota bacterium]|nr:hypothetical protein [Chloroflexota bacterium]